MNKKCPSAALIFLTLSFGYTAFAEGPGEPTIGDINLYNLTEVLKAQQQATRAKADANERIAAARTLYFSSAPGTAQHKAAEAEFATLLRDKDIIYASQCVATGVQDGLARANGVGILTGGGGMFDNGIPRLAVTSFGNWVNAVRTSLGAKSDRELLFPSEEAFGKALAENTPAYAKYKRARDKVEYGMWLSVHPGTKQTLGHLPLGNQEIFPATGVEMASIFPDAMVTGLRRLPLDVKQKLLICAYGPTYSSEGEELFTLQKFWYEAPPPDISNLLSIDADEALKFLGDKGYERCPATDGDAQYEMDKAQMVFADPRYAVPRAAATQQGKEKQASYDQLNAACAQYSANIKTIEPVRFAVTIRRYIDSEFRAICQTTPSNLGATEVTVDPHAVCSRWYGNLAGARDTSKPQLPGALALIESYDRHCAPRTGDLFAANGAPVPGSTRVDGQRNATTVDPNADPHARQCELMWQNLDKARARAHGVRENLGVSSMESSITRQCGKR